ncbi:family 5 glycoside hydrolase [Cryphonectria parasitica EP155]|uniref:Family 5 glycoside hydrolase n=1 Tax=Cryphonectria parasitica (strain ATCC 38755 / EP155) TaxID=660469 RepID=A0A9P5CL47_CRYP1|nr:family 5 glycoside hydrolase [Cryphonectria parasitica EP155]KAF3762693.1 family 5 glycoside hydrolase [Cryphonectria parasitica EP155]
MLRKVVTVAALAVVVAADETWTINATSNWGTWDGWGVSLAWWAKAFGTRDDLADIFFSLDSTTYDSVSLPGLGFNIARYNAGACSNSTYDDTTMVVSPDMIASRQMDGYWWDWASGDPTSSSWHWDVDANQRSMLSKAVANGANHIELFSNSPMWWMLYNKNPSGSDDGSSDNLQSWNYDNHTHYLAEIALYAKDNWGVTFESIEPFNEPSADYWVGTTGTQEGCHFDISTQATVIESQRAALTSLGLSSAIVSASDENTYDEAVTTFDGLGSTALKDLGRINVHGYEDGSGNRDGLYALASGAGLALWNSEYGDSDATGSSLVSNLILDLRWLHPTGWVYWQAIDGGGWGLIDGDNDDLTLGSPSQKYFCLAQFTRHIREGMRILDGGADHVVAAYDEVNSKLIIVAVNWGDAQYLNFELSGFSTPGTSGQTIPRWSTEIGSGDQYVSTPADTVQDGTVFWSYFDTNEVQTFEVANVKI